VHLNDDHPEALNWTTGETVAIKKISLSDIPKAELGDIMVSEDNSSWWGEGSKLKFLPAFPRARSIC
jgi:hypothetical protein